MIALSAVILLMNIFQLIPKCCLNILEQDLLITTAGVREAEGQSVNSSMLELVFASYANIHKLTSSHSQWEDKMKENIQKRA